MKQFLKFVQKEFFHIFRDPRTMLILLAIPIIEIVLFGFAISTEVKNSRVAIYNPSKDMITERIVEKLGSSEYFTITHTLHSPQEVDRLMRRGEIDMAVIFSENFSANTGRYGADVQLITDATDPNTATIASNYATAIISSAYPASQIISTKVNLLYNPSMKSAYNFVPGVMGLILMLICAMMTSISIVREKERGTMEMLLVSPMRPIYIIVAKAIPYFTLSFVNLITILLLSFFVLAVPISGSLFWLGLMSLLFIFVALSLGLLISTLVNTQIAAMMASGMVLMMPTMLLSGMMFPIENMPLPLQWFSALLPARWFIAAVRKLMIEGVGVRYVLHEFAILSAMAVVLLTISLKKFKIRMQ